MRDLFIRPSNLFFALVLAILVADLFLYLDGAKRTVVHNGNNEIMRDLVGGLGLTDLAVASEARYTRHPAVSDAMVPFMDHPGAIEHFPTGSFWRPVQ